MADKITIEDYIQAAGDTSKRSRSIIMLIITASVLTFASSWNASPYSWISCREDMARDALKWFGWKDSVRQTLSEEDKKLFDRSRDFATSPVLDSLKLNSYLETFTKFDSENIMYIRVPFFGITFDVNDLGMLGGFTFVILLIMLRLSFSRELSSLRIVFKRSSLSENHDKIYEIMKYETDINNSFVN